MTYEEKQRQWQDGTFRRIVKNACGTVCYNCGATENIQYHHIVPLKLGGTNNLSNIAALCSQCHKAVHWGKHIQDYRSTENMGRPRIAKDDVIQRALDAFFGGYIGTAECAKRVGIKAKKPHLTDRIWYKEYVKTRKIRKIVNEIDWHRHFGKELNSGDSIGYIEYEDGRKETLYYQGKRVRQITIWDFIDGE